MDNAFVYGIKKGEIAISKADSTALSTMVNRFHNLGQGELEAITIAFQSGIPGQYIILSDDGLARKKANEMGIKSLGILAFIIHANKKGILSKGKAIQHVDTLARNRFSLKPNVYSKFLSELA